MSIESAFKQYWHTVSFSSIHSGYLEGNNYTVWIFFCSMNSLSGLIHSMAGRCIQWLMQNLWRAIWESGDGAEEQKNPLWFCDVHQHSCDSNVHFLTIWRIQQADRRKDESVERGFLWTAHICQHGNELKPTQMLVDHYYELKQIQGCTLLFLFSICTPNSYLNYTTEVNLGIRTFAPTRGALQ